MQNKMTFLDLKAISLQFAIMFDYWNHYIPLMCYYDYDYKLQDLCDYDYEKM